MPVIVVDTNVFVSGLKVAGSKPADVIDTWRRGDFELAVSQEILEEYFDVLTRPELNIALTDIREIMNYILFKAVMVEQAEKVDLIAEDRSDNKFLECARGARADYIISGDHHLLDLKEFEGTKILTASEYLSIPR